MGFRPFFMSEITYRPGWGGGAIGNKAKLNKPVPVFTIYVYPRPLAFFKVLQFQIRLIELSGLVI